MTNRLFLIKHTDGISDVTAKVESVLQKLYFVYKINGMFFSRAIPYEECINYGLIEKKNILT
jgi:hypothetical protein